MVREVNGLQEAIRLVLGELLSVRGPAARPRGLPTAEVLGGAVKIADPRRRLVLRPPRRKWSLAFAMAEYLWYMRGENSLKTMAFYAPGIRQFSDDGETLYSAYGHRIFGASSDIGFDQWEQAKRRLVEDPESRQALLHIRVPRDSLVRTKDQPCTIALQFLQRSGKLHMVATMRSNDIVLGTPYDIFSFTMMQEQMALELGLELGSYYHQVGSWHLYSDQRALAEEMVELTTSPPPMPRSEPGLAEMIADEERIRRGETVAPGTGYWRDWRLVLNCFAGLADETPELRAEYREAWEMGRRLRKTSPPD